MYKAKIKVTLRNTILDPQGKTIENSLHTLGFNTISDTRIGKYLEMNVASDKESEARNIVENACKKLLANPVMEDYEFELIKN
jgi:phosphoribosylformylglycinamidine synthase